MGTKKNSSVGHKPAEGAGTWEFDQEVAQCFDDMLNRSVPCYTEAHKLFVSLVESRLAYGDTVLDLGVSTAYSFRALRDRLPFHNLIYVGSDVSEAMLVEAKSNFPDATYTNTPAQQYLHGWSNKSVGAIYLSLTLQFIPVEHRQEIIHNCYRLLKNGGTMFFFEKCLGHDHYEEELHTKLYYERKQANGYSPEEIAAKRKSLENVLVPLTAEGNESLLEREGFRLIPLVRWCNFVAWAAIKE